jgi:ATP-dependent DNA helicase RecG
MTLDSKVTDIPKIGQFYSAKLSKLNIVTLSDLLHHIPNRYIDFRKKARIADVRPGEIVTVSGSVEFIKNQFSKSGTKIQIAEIRDKSGRINVIWFNQPYLIMTIKKGQEISVAGEVSWFGRNLALISPEYEIKSINVHTGRLIPVYPGTSGISSKWLRTKIKTAYDLTTGELKEFFPTKILSKYDLETFSESIRKIHFPESVSDIDIARRRLAINELFYFQLSSLHKKKNWERNVSVHQISKKDKEVEKFIKNLPFVLTQSQKKCVKEIIDDLCGKIPMNRLLEGDVGSGKTVVAAIACYLNFLNGYQSVIMAPTQILALQHYKTLTEMFTKFKIRLNVITSNQTVKDVGRADIIIGTHALLFNKILFENVTLVVIDEQHKFGVKQRSFLIKRVGNNNLAPHVLTMTATPIPRSIALTVYGDLDLSIIDELPQGRTETKTYVVPQNKREDAYEWIKKLIKKEKIQAYVICPLIDVSDKETMEQVRAVNAEYNKLKLVFKGFKVDLLHGKMKNADKKRSIDDFYEGKTDILVSTPVVEVGVDVPNANIMIVETAERFGLAQLHQLRGRIGRGKKESYCLLFADIISGNTRHRLSALTKENSGFKLAEMDMKLRGPGEIFGIKQHGFPELKIAKWDDLNLIKISKEIAEYAINKPHEWKHLNKLKGGSDISLN